MNLGEKIQQLRKQKGLSQEQLATQITVSRQAISKWELGEAKPDTDHVIQLSKIFNVSIDYLLIDDNDKSTDTENEASATSVSVQESRISVQKIIGLILLGVGLVAIVLVTIFSDIISALTFCVPLIVCGVICLTVKKHIVLWLGWTLFLLFYLFQVFVFGNSPLWIFNGWRYSANGITFRVVLDWIMALGLIVLIGGTGRVIYKNKKGK